jgi:hypothetical protein
MKQFARSTCNLNVISFRVVVSFRLFPLFKKISARIVRFHEQPIGKVVRGEGRVLLEV